MIILSKRRESHSAEASDGSLLRRIKDGEQDAATQLYLRYSQRLASLAKANTAKELTARFDPEDIVQSVFRSFFRRVSAGSYDVPEGGELWRLLLVLALNKVRQTAIRHRAKKRDAGNTLSLHGYDSVENELTGFDQEPLKILELVIEEILQGMSAIQRKMIELRIEGCTVDEISAATGRSKRSVERVVKGFKDDLAIKIDTEKEVADR